MSAGFCGGEIQSDRRAGPGHKSQRRVACREGQRLPVRIELEGYDPDKKPLFIGASVVPYVYLNKPLSGPNAGAFLQAVQPQSAGSASTGSASGAGK